MWVTGRVRDRVEHAAAEAAMGETIFVGACPDKNGGAPSSLRRPQSPHQTWALCERDLFQRLRRVHSRRSHKPFSYTPVRWQNQSRRGPTASERVQ